MLFICSALRRPVLLRALAEATLPEEERSDLPDADEEADLDQMLDPGEGPAFLVAPGMPLDPDAPLQITAAGREMHFVSTLLEDWLADAPQGPLELGEAAASRAVAGLVYGWATTLVHALAEQPLSLSELDRALGSVSPAAVEEHTALMEWAGLVEPEVGDDGETRYALTDWLRQGVAPLAAAARLECHFPAADTLPPDRRDVEAAFRLALALLELPRDVSGTCSLGVPTGGEGHAAMAGATVTIERGRIVSSIPQPRQPADAWATASAIDWLDTLVDPRLARIEVGGDEHLAASLLAGLHERLFSRTGPGP